MSREFGTCQSGYFHTQMQYAVEDLSCGQPLSKVWAKFFEEFQHVAYDIASAEASDCGPDRPILETIRRMDALKSALYDVEMFVRPYKDVAERAVREAVAGRETLNTRGN